MSTAEEAFLSDIRANPEDDGVRRIYADWLQENGQPQRAEFIRMQLDLARLSEDDPQREALADRQDELLARWERVWLGGWDEVLEGWAFRRGLVEAVRADASVFLDHAPGWFARWPTLRVAKLTRASSPPTGAHSPRACART